jgi:hypothetical protein
MTNWRGRHHPCNHASKQVTEYVKLTYCFTQILTDDNKQVKQSNLCSGISLRTHTNNTDNIHCVEQDCVFLEKVQTNEICSFCFGNPFVRSSSTVYNRRSLFCTAKRILNMKIQSRTFHFLANFASFRKCVFGTSRTHEHLQYRICGSFCRELWETTNIPPPSQM